MQCTKQNYIIIVLALIALIDFTNFRKGSWAQKLGLLVSKIVETASNARYVRLG